MEPGHDIGVVFHFGEDDGVAWLEKLAGIAVGDHIYGVVGVGCEDDFFGGVGVYEFGDLVAGCFVSGCCGFGELVGAAVDVCVAVGIEVCDGVDD